ncbi:MAG: hypothetical protein B7Y39_18830 [Bdellovibrio sp. 28-41-41]|nr:MAG: hypothetical protein B7Y39_18830 [Bdellovibrio sp. 28-41-41]
MNIPPKESEMIKNWISLASMAPSGANLQPWAYSYIMANERIKFSLSICKDHLTSPSSIDPFFVAAAMGIGAFAKNLQVAASCDGYECTMLSSRGDTPQTWFWDLSFEKSSAVDLENIVLKEAIFKRVSNRHAFIKTPMLLNDWEKTLKSLNKNPNFSLIRDTANRKIWSRLLSKLESIRCNDEKFRSELFNEIRNRSEILKEPVGLPIDTVTNSWVEKFSINILKRWSKLQVVLSFGAAYIFIQSSVKKPLINSGDILVLQSKSRQPRDSFEMGMLLEELWLGWTKAGYSVQILALPLIILGGQSPGFKNRLSKKNINALLEASKIGKEKLGIDLSLPTLVIRLGKAITSSPQSPRRAVLVQS